MLPAAHLAGAEEDGDGLALLQGLFQGRRPRRAGDEIPAVHEAGQAVVLEPPADAFDGRIVAGVVAQEDVVGAGEGVHRRHAFLATGARGHGLERVEAPLNLCSRAAKSQSARFRRA